MGDEQPVVLSPLPKTWLLDLDGTLVRHNGHKLDGKDSFLPGAKEFLANLPDTDTIIILTSRTDEYLPQTKAFLEEEGIRYDHIINNLPFGERIVINDDKPSGLTMAYAVSKRRDVPLNVNFVYSNK